MLVKVSVKISESKTKRTININMVFLITTKCPEQGEDWEECYGKNSLYSEKDK